MKRWLPLLASTLFASSALADPPAASATGPTQKAAATLVAEQLVVPLKKAESERRRFSRARPPAVERRVRVLDSVAKTDKRGKQFVRFAIDERFKRREDLPWEKDALLGCAYLHERQVFVQDGERYLFAASMLGAEEQKAPADVCKAAPANGNAELASARR